MVDIVASMVKVKALDNAAWNPRSISDSELESLRRSILADPGFLWSRPILARANGEVYAGNQRLHVVRDILNWTEVPAILEDVTEAVAKERAVRDNNQWGAWQAEGLSQLMGELATSPLDLGFKDGELDRLLKSLQVKEPPEFKEVDEDIETNHECPRCGFAWSE